jgi:acyl-CoA thioester hydrolase
MTAECRFHYPIRVRYCETDGQEIVFNSRYLEYCDAACTEYFRAAGIAPQEMLSIHHLDVVIAHAELDYISPARYDDLLQAFVRTSKIGRTSLTMHIEIRREDGQTVICRILIKYVNYDRATGKPAPVPPSIRDAIAKIEGQAITS